MANEALRDRSEMRVTQYFDKLELDANLLESIQLNKGVISVNDSLKYNTDFHKFRTRNASQDVSSTSYRVSNYLSKNETIAKAQLEAKRFSSDKFRPIKIQFRQVQPLKSHKKAFELSPTCEVARIKS